MRCTTVLIALLYLSLSPLFAASGDILRTVAISGAQTPGTVNGVTFADFYRYSVPGQLVFPVINNLGQVAFTGSITGTGVNDSNDVAIFGEEGGNGLALVQRTSEPTPFFGEGLSALPKIDDEGDVYFYNVIEGASGLKLGLFRHAHGDTHRIDITEELFPAAQPGQYYRGANSMPQLSDGGRAVFQASLFEFVDDGDPFTNDEVRRDHAIFRERPGGGIERVATEGQAVPGLELGVTFGSAESVTGVTNNVFVLRGPLNSGPGQIAFGARLKGVGVTSQNSFALFRSNPDNNELVLIARDGDAAPLSEPGLTLRVGGVAHTNTHGQSSFLASLIGPDNSSQGSGLFVENAGAGLRTVARNGLSAPGTQGEFRFERFENNQINARGEVAFRAGIRNINTSRFEYGIFSEVHGALNMVARSGQLAPETENGVIIDTLYGGLTGFASNVNGQVAFDAILAGPGVSNANNEALYATDLSGNLHLIVREGDLLDASDDPLVHDFRIVKRYNFNGEELNYTGTQLGFNDRGQIVFSAEFSDGTGGVFVSSLVSVVPEPASLTISVWIAVIGSLYTRRMRLPRRH